MPRSPATTAGSGTGVNDADYPATFPLTVALSKLTIKVDRPQLTPEDIRKLVSAQRTASRASRGFR